MSKFGRCAWAAGWIVGRVEYSETGSRVRRELKEARMVAGLGRQDGTRRAFEVRIARLKARGVDVSAVEGGA